jgi:SAM-dependent methyltransferase
MISINSISLKANDYSNPNYLGSKFRKKRFRLFEEKIKSLSKPVTILDIGGTVRFWIDEGYHKKDILITIINVLPEVSGYSNIRVITADACDLSIFKDKAFDISFSNSLIEHLHTKDKQIKMANEAMRVSKYFFIQTPNRYFPVEPHFKFPFFQFLPRFLQIFLQTKTSIINGVRYKKEYAVNIVKEIRLLSKKEMKELFPKSQLHVERVLGLAKSFVAYNFKD